MLYRQLGHDRGHGRGGVIRLDPLSAHRCDDNDDGHDSSCAARTNRLWHCHRGHRRRGDLFGCTSRGESVGNLRRRRATVVRDRLRSPAASALPNPRGTGRGAVRLVARASASRAVGDQMAQSGWPRILALGRLSARTERASRARPQTRPSHEHPHRFRTHAPEMVHRRQSARAQTKHRTSAVTCRRASLASLTP
jgi:hypothetical protein